MEIILNNNRKIGDKFAPYFIAEVNTSHFGDIEKAKDLIDAVKKLVLIVLNFNLGQLKVYIALIFTKKTQWLKDL